MMIYKRAGGFVTQVEKMIELMEKIASSLKEIETDLKFLLEGLDED